MKARTDGESGGGRRWSGRWKSEDEVWRGSDIVEVDVVVVVVVVVGKRRRLSGDSVVGHRSAKAAIDRYADADDDEDGDAQTGPKTYPKPEE